MDLKYTSAASAAALSLALLLAACHGGEFRVDGSVGGADSAKEKTIVLERPGLDGRWIPIDSTEISSSGSFTFHSPAPKAPEIYRLRLADSYIYFPVDSLENITVTTDASDFGRDFSLEGSENATALASFERELLDRMPVLSIPDSAAAFKRHVFTTYLQDTKGSVVSYYILTKTVGGRPLFSPEADNQYFSAVATAFAQYRPSDPRTPLLEKAAREGRRAANRQKGASRVVEAGEISLLEIELPDENGRMQKLSAHAGAGRPTILVFSNMTQEGAPAFNMELRKFYDEKGGRVGIYHVSLDPSRHAWSDAASNLPWTTVYAAGDEAAAKVASDYNLQALPTMYIYDSRGSLIDRADDMAALRRKTASY